MHPTPTPTQCVEWYGLPEGCTMAGFKAKPDEEKAACGIPAETATYTFRGIWEFVCSLVLVVRFFRTRLQTKPWVKFVVFAANLLIAIVDLALGGRAIACAAGRISQGVINFEYVMKTLLQIVSTIAAFDTWFSDSGLSLRKLKDWANAQLSRLLNKSWW